MIALLNWRVWAALALAVALAASHWKAYSMGGAEYRAKMAERNAELMAEAATASEANRKTEQAMAAKLRKAQDDYAKMQKVNAGNALELARVRGDFKTALNSRCTANPTAPGCSDGGGRLERKLLGECAGVVVELATTTQRLADKVIGLQRYVGVACSPP